jgi:uncharacterized protein involved in exopolysaccharide biosynthesis/Mrp family chromosome partitioning ATPase
MNTMNTNRPVEHSTGLSLGDIYYVLFRHKWKILCFALAGFAAAAGVYFFKPPPYQSQAELLIKYVPETTALSLVGDNQKVLVPDSRGQDIINSEIQILTSLDLAEEAVTNLGAASILAGAGGGSNAVAAAAVIHHGLEAAPADKGGSVIVVSFKHPNPQIVQPVLQEIINDYLQKHYEIHSAPGQFDDALSRERSTLSVQLNDTEQQLAELKNRASIISLDGSTKGLADQISQIRGSILNAEADLSGYEAAMKIVDHNQSPKPDTTNAPPAIPSDQIDAYIQVCRRLDALQKQEQGYVMQGFTSSNILVQSLDQQIADAEKIKGGLEKKYPQMAGLSAVSPAPGGSAAAPVLDVRTQMSQIAALQAKIKVWNTQLDQLQTQATNLNNLAPTIETLEGAKASQLANLQNVSESLEKSHIDQALASVKAPNIKSVQKPSPPFRDWKKTHKVIMGLAFGGLAFGLALAFFIELFLDRTVKRPVEIEARLKLPLFLSIPDVSRNGHARLPTAPERRQLRFKNRDDEGKPAEAGDTASAQANTLQVVSLEKNRALQPFYEALRDRLIANFEVRNLTHKPKLVAVTSAGAGAGVSTVAAGLAASLSETGDGNVLLVDMNLEGGAAQQFCKGKPGCGLDTALSVETKEDALVQENLYVVTGNSNSDKLPRVMPKRFAALVPKLKASDFDYIIFDMPPVTQTSITSRLAGFMDQVLLVIESEKTDQDVVRRANAWLTESGAKVSAVLNKAHKYVPHRLHQEFLADK